MWRNRVHKDPPLDLVRRKLNPVQTPLNFILLLSPKLRIVLPVGRRLVDPIILVLKRGRSCNRKVVFCVLFAYMRLVSRNFQTGCGVHLSTVQWVSGLFLKVERPGRSVDHTPLSSAEINNECRCTCTLSMCLRGLDIDKFNVSLLIVL
jgi:hypothetical protein